jgi:hypothetical protein
MGEQRRRFHTSQNSNQLCDICPKATEWKLRVQDVLTIGATVFGAA